MSEQVPEPQSSPEAQQMVDAGARPNDVDVAALLAQMKALQDRVDAMSAQQGIPADPVEAALKNLSDHVKARAAANPNHDFSLLISTLDDLDESLDSRNAERLDIVTQQHVNRHSMLDLAYLKELAGDLRMAVLNAGR